MTAKDFTYTLPEDYEMKPEHRAKLDAVFDEIGIKDNALAQKLIDIHVEIMEEYANELEAAYASAV